MDNSSTVAANLTQHSQQPGIDADIKITLYTILLVWSLIGNILVIAVVARNKNLRTNFTHLIVNMAVSDLVIPLLALPVRITHEAGGRPYEWLVYGRFGSALCKLCYFFADMSPAVSVFSLVIIALERFILTLYPVKRYLFTAKLNFIFIGVTWVAAMLLVSPYLYTFRLHIIDGYTICYPFWYPAFDETSAQTIFILIAFVVAFLIPFTSITILYSLMLYRLHQNNQTVTKAIVHSRDCSQQSRNKSVFYISIAIVVAFGLLWGPYYCWVFAANFIIKSSPGFPKIEFIIQYLAYTNSAINPCIYFIFLKSFRRGLSNLWRRKQNSTPLVVPNPNRHRENQNDPVEPNKVHQETEF